MQGRCKSVKQIVVRFLRLKRLQWPVWQERCSGHALRILGRGEIRAEPGKEQRRIPEASESPQSLAHISSLSEMLRAFWDDQKSKVLSIVKQTDN